MSRGRRVAKLLPQRQALGERCAAYREDDVDERRRREGVHFREGEQRNRQGPRTPGTRGERTRGLDGHDRRLFCELLNGFLPCASLNKFIRFR